MPAASDSLFQPPVERWERLSPKFLTVKLIGVVLGWLIVIAITTIGAYVMFLDSEFSWTWWLVLAVGLGFLAWRVIRMPFWVKRWGYAERDEDVYLTQGLMFRRLTCVPYGRMQLVEVTAGPIERMFGLATVQMVTASSSGAISIPGLDRAAAEAVRDRFINRGQHLRAGI